jgi:hypothetical protein
LAETASFDEDQGGSRQEHQGIGRAAFARAAGVDPFALPPIVPVLMKIKVSSGDKR